MTNRSMPDPLRGALHSLPRVPAAEGFTERVLAAADTAAEKAALPRRPLARRRLAAAAALAVLVLAGAVAVPTFHAERAARHERQARIQGFEAERQRLAAELEEIRRLAATPPADPPVLYLGGDEDVDLVLDLGRLADLHPGGTGATPAAYHGRPSY